MRFNFGRVRAWLAGSAIVGASLVSAAERELLGAATLGEWEFVTPERVAPVSEVVHVENDGAILCAGKPTGFLATKAVHRDYRLTLEWRWTSQPGNGGVLLHIVSGPKDRAWPVSFQVQTKHKSVGDLLPMAGATFSEPLTSPAGATQVKAHSGADAERPAGEWNRGEIICRGGEIAVTVNGMALNRVTGCSESAGRIGLQFEGAPFAVRAVRIEPLDP